MAGRKRRRRRGARGVTSAVAAYGYPWGPIYGVQVPVLGPQFPEGPAAGEAGGSGGEAAAPA